MSRSSRSARPAAWLAAALALAATARPASAQQTFDRYEQLYGTPIDVSLSDLVMNSMMYEGRAIRTRGTLDFPSTNMGSRDIYVLREFGARVLIYPVRDLAGLWEQEARTMLGQQIEVTGIYQRGQQTGGLATPDSIGGALQIWKFVGPPEKPDPSLHARARPLTLERLVGDPGRQDGQLVRVVGVFRGANLFGDLPVRSRLDSKDWVIKDDVWSVWITGRKPKGDGFDLDPCLRRDTGKWLEVVGRVDVRGRHVYIRASQVALAAPPTPTAEAQPPPPPPERPRKPPVVVFALPLDGERGVPQDARFTVQFNKDMDEKTFAGRVLLRYADGVQAGDRPFVGLQLSYDGGRRALTVDPGDVLRPGRVLELVLLPGILDLDGLELQPRTEGPRADAVDVLRFWIG